MNSKLFQVKKIRVLDLINTDKSARELLDHRVAQVNATNRYSNAIYCSSGEYVNFLRNRGHEVYVVDTPRGLSPFTLLQSTWKTYRLLAKEKFDIVHTHGTVIGMIGRLAAFLARTPIVVHQVHGFYHHKAMGRVQQHICIAMERLLGFITDKLIIQNQADVQECLARAIAPKGKLVLIGNGICLEDFARQAEPDNDPKIILCVARFEPVKNHMMLLEAARILKARGLAFIIQLVGDGELRETYEAWVSRHQLQNVVHFLGYRDDVPALTTKADICVLVSIKEGLPRAIIEAAAAGRPMIATDVVGNRDALLDGKTALLVPLNDVTALADKIELLLLDTRLRSCLGSEAQEYSRKNFDERVVTSRIIKLYDQLIRYENYGRLPGTQK